MCTRAWHECLEPGPTLFYYWHIPPPPPPTSPTPSPHTYITKCLPPTWLQSDNWSASSFICQRSYGPGNLHCSASGIVVWDETTELARFTVRRSYHCIGSLSVGSQKPTQIRPTGDNQVRVLHWIYLYLSLYTLRLNMLCSRLSWNISNGSTPRNKVDMYEIIDQRTGVPAYWSSSSSSNFVTV